MMESVRIRLEFEDRHILSKSQRSDGLKRSWFLLKSQQHQTISDLSSYLLRIFDLHQSCPNGLLLSMDGFGLPPFESTCILKDKDIVSVKKKGVTLSEIIKVGDGVNSVEEIEIVDKQPVHTGMLLLANEEFEKETRGYQREPKEDEENQSEDNETKEDEEDQSEDTLPLENMLGGNAVSKKRKASKKLQSSKKKKHRSDVPDGVEKIESYHNNGVLPRKSIRKKEKVSDAKREPNMASPPESADRNNNDVVSTPNVKSDQLQVNGEGIKDELHMPGGSKKVPSRSARRKKAKRKWLQEMAKIGKKELHRKKKVAKDEKKEEVCHSKGLLHWKQLPEKVVHKNMTKPQQQNQKNDAEEDVVPIVIRPGHIRFEPLEQDQIGQRSQVSVETFQWNGITSKKKGQKWGTEKISSALRNDYKDLNKEYSEMLTVEEEIPVIDPINFDKLPPLPSMPGPKGGDVIAYRLLELSSSWTPELSSFRVGKISWYNQKSRRIMLKPVPQYPIFPEKLDEDTSALQPDDSLYREDGSLEADFSSLVDIRIIKPRNSDPAKAITVWVDEGPTGNKDATSSLVPSNKDEQTYAPITENGEVNLWDHFSEAVNAKKAQLSEENDWSIVSSGRSAWSYKALRGSALGPTMALLRSKNDI